VFSEEIKKLLDSEDKKFINLKLSKHMIKHRSFIAKNYELIFWKEYEKEIFEHKKRNAGARAANSYLRDLKVRTHYDRVT